MNLVPMLVPNPCAICGTPKNARQLYPANCSFRDFSPDIFSARRIPDKIHYRIVQCQSCGLVRSDPVIGQETLKNLYMRSGLTYAKDIPNLRRTYGIYLHKLEKYKARKECLLEIGCGNGFMLEEALSQGYNKVLGVEPSQNAVQQTNPALKEFIYNDVMRPGLLARKVDAICMFQLFDHIPNPNEFLDTCSEILNPGGLVLCFNHNVRAVSARVLGENSPIIDIEHTFLYSPDTIRNLYQKNGLEVLEVGPARNCVNLLSILRLLPISRSLKTRLLVFVEGRPKLGQISGFLPLGNLYLIAQKG